jgi:hypothetical protein
MSSRIRKLEIDLDRSRPRDPFDLTMNMPYDQVIEMAKAGIPIEVIVERFHNRLPISVIKKIVSGIERGGAVD